MSEVVKAVKVKITKQELIEHLGDIDGKLATVAKTVTDIDDTGIDPADSSKIVIVFKEEPDA
jgi:hypothetical protein